MSKVDIALLALTLGLAGAGTYLLSALHAERGHVSTTQSERDRLDEQAPPLELAATLPSHAAATRPAETQTPQRPFERPDPEQAFQLSMFKLLQTPEGRALVVAHRKLQQRASYAGIAEALSLTPEEEDTVLGYLVEPDIRMIELRARGGSPKREFFKEYNKSREALATHLGAETFERFEEFQASLSARTEVGRLRAELPDADALSDEQAATLINALTEEAQAANEKQARRHESGTVVESGFASGAGYSVLAGESRKDSMERQMKDYHDRISKRASKVLTASQLKVFEVMQENARAQSRAAWRAAQSDFPE